MKLKVEALRMLQSELHPNEMVAIYIMEFGTEVPPKLIKHLTKIVKLLCQKLDWIDDGCHPPGLVTKSIFYLLTYLCKKWLIQILTLEGLFERTGQPSRALYLTSSIFYWTQGDTRTPSGVGRYAEAERFLMITAQD